MNKLSIFAAIAATLALSAVPAIAADSTASTSSTTTATTTTPPPDNQAPAAKKHGGPGAIFEQLDLTDAQKPQIKQIFTDARSKAKDVKNDDSLSPEDKKAKLKQIQKDAMEAAIAILTDAQKAKLKELLPEKGEKGHGDRLAENLDYLNLTDAQKDQIAKIKSAAETQAAAVKADATLSDDQKTAKLTDIRKDAVKQFIAILTPDQKKLFVEHRKGGGDKGGDAKPAAENN